MRQILTSRATIGHLETKSGIIENIFPPVVPEELWLRVQVAMEARRGHGGAKMRSFINVLAGFCRCADCGGNMRVNANAATGYRYYECKNHSSFHTCANRCRYRVDMVEKAILSNIGLVPVSTQADGAPADLGSLAKNLETLKAREAILASQLQKLDSEEIADLVLAQLREIRASKNDAATALLVAKKRAAVGASPSVKIRSLTDRVRLHAALKERIQLVLFGEDNTAAAFVEQCRDCGVRSGSEGRRRISTLPDAVRWGSRCNAGATTGAACRCTRELATEIGADHCRYPATDQRVHMRRISVPARRASPTPVLIAAADAVRTQGCAGSGATLVAGSARGIWELSSYFRFSNVRLQVSRVSDSGIRNPCRPPSVGTQCSRASPTCAGPR